MSIVTVDVVAVKGKPMWRAVVDGIEYLEDSGRRIHELVSRMTLADCGSGSMGEAQH